jgi:hypothetical protein
MEANARQMAADSSADAGGNNGLGPSHDQPSPLVGQLIQRQRRRRMDLRTLHGVARESAKLYRLLAQGQMLPAQAEVRSRVLRRHSEILSTLQVESLAKQFEEWQRRPPLPAYGDYASDGSITQDVVTP